MSDGAYRAQLPWLALCPDNQRFGRSHNGQNILSDKYRDAKSMATLHLMKAKGMARPRTHVIEVWYRFWVPDLRRRDCTNLIKLLSDAMQEAEVVADDTLFKLSHVANMGVDRKNPRVEITLTALTQPIPLD